MHKNRGMFLETLINKTIDFYEDNEVAMFHKKTLDINFASSKRVGQKNLLEKSYITGKSTTDYYGVYQGRYIAFEAKSTKLSSLPLQSIKDHQVHYLQNVVSIYQGLAFLLIYFASYNHVFMLFIQQLQHLDHHKKSISIPFCQKHGIKVPITYPGIIDFIAFL